ncbi:MAG: hypothetical protein M1416_02235 [Candidatus Pacearchaeota archaeon]|nr:hypothetical protein [Candidatus Pacearchaeota archaeon]
MIKGLKKNHKGLSPVITTVLLIALVVVSTSIVFLWFRGMVEEGVTKFGKNIKLVCDDVDFTAEYSSGALSIVNDGNIPIFRVDLRIESDGNFETIDVTDIAGINWPATGLAQGGAFSGDISSEVGSASKITVFPILIGTSSSGQKTYICGGGYGKELAV